MTSGPGVKEKLHVPTAVLCRPVITGWKTKWEMYAFGQQAIDLHLQDEEAASFPLFRNFKMALHAQKVSLHVVDLCMYSELNCRFLCGCCYQHLLYSVCFVIGIQYYIEPSASSIQYRHLVQRLK